MMIGIVTPEQPEKVSASYFVPPRILNPDRLRLQNGQFPL